MAKVKAMHEAPIVYVDPRAMLKMQMYTRNCDKEIGWLGTAEKINKDYLIKDVFLFKQEVHSTTTEITPEGLSEFIQEVFIEYENEQAMDIVNNLNVWGHSHVDMGVFASNQDDKQMLTFKDSGYDWFIRLITNKKNELSISIYDFSAGIIWDDVSSSVHFTVDGLEEEIKAEIEEKVTEKKKVSTYMYNYGSDIVPYWNKYNDYSQIAGAHYNTNKTSKVVNITKNEEEEEKEEERILDLEEELMNMIDVYDLYTLGTARTVEEMKKKLKDIGIQEDVFNDEELEILFRLAQVAYEDLMTGGWQFD